MSETQAAPTPKIVKSFGVSLKMNGGVMRIQAVRRKDGSAQSFTSVFTGEKNKEGKKVSTRGASAQHPSIEEARARVERLTDKAIAKGWAVTKGGGGSFRSRADAFDEDNLPAPPKKTKG